MYQHTASHSVTVLHCTVYTWYVSVCLHAFMRESVTTVLTWYSTPVHFIAVWSTLFEQFFTLIWWNITSAGVCSPGNNHHNIFTLLEKTIIINYKFAARLPQRYAWVLFVFAKTNTLSGLSVRRDGVWTTSGVLFLEKTPSFFNEAPAVVNEDSMRRGMGPLHPVPFPLSPSLPPSPLCAFEPPVPLIF